MEIFDSKTQRDRLPRLDALELYFRGSIGELPNLATIAIRRSNPNDGFRVSPAQLPRSRPTDRQNQVRA